MILISKEGMDCVGGGGGGSGAVQMKGHFLLQGDILASYF